jgi:tetratricopeptide (TPR) repeat protein
LGCLTIILSTILLGFSPVAAKPEPAIINGLADCSTVADHLQSFNLIDALAHRAQLRLLSNDFDEARADLDAAITLEPENPALYVLRGQVFLALYEWDLSLADYNTAIWLNPTYADTYFYRGVLRYSILQTGFSTHREALNDFEQYVRMAPTGQYVQLAESYAEAIRQTLQSLEQAP